MGMRYYHLLSVIGLLVAAIASTSTDATAQASRIRIPIYGRNAPVLVDSLASAYDVKGSRAATYTAAAQALLQLGATIDHRDSLNAIVGMTTGQLRRRLGTVRL